MASWWDERRPSDPNGSWWNERPAPASAPSGGFLSRLDPAALGLLGASLLAANQRTTDPNFRGRMIQQGLSQFALQQQLAKQRAEEQPFRDLQLKQAQAEIGALEADRQRRERASGLLQRYLGGGGPAGPGLLSRQPSATGAFMTQPTPRPASGQATVGGQFPAHLMPLLSGMEPDKAIETLMDYGLRAPAEIKPPPTRTVRMGSEQVTQEFVNGKWQEVGRGAAFRPADTTTVNVNTGELPEYSKLEPGFVYETDAAGNILRDERGLPRVVPIPGSQAAQERAKAAEMKASRRESEVGKATIVEDDIGRALDLSDGWTTGFAGGTTRFIPGTRAYDLSSLLDTIRANIGFDRLQDMRSQSPTGGALGQVSEFENRLLQATMGALDQSQSREQFEYNLKRVKNRYLDIIHGEGKGPAREPLRKAPPQDMLTPTQIQSMTLDELDALANSADFAKLTPDQKRMLAERYDELIGGR